MTHMGLADNVLHQQDVAPTTGFVNVNGAVIDMKGWDGVEFVFNIGAIASTGTLDAHVTSCPNINMTNATNIAGAALVQVPNTANTALAIIDVWRPTDRYVQLVLNPAVANVTVGVTSIRYRRAGILPPTQVATQYVKIAQN